MGKQLLGNTKFILRIYDGETEDEDQLLGQSTSVLKAASTESTPNQGTIRVSLEKRPSDAEGKILVTAEYQDIGRKVQQVYQLRELWM